MTDYPKTINAAGIEVVDTSDGAWNTYLAEGRDQLTRAEAAQAEVRHELAMAKAAGLAALSTVQFDPEVATAARQIHNQDPSGPSSAAIVERVIIPLREAYLARFESKAPVATHRAGPNEEAFNKLLGGK
jgi:hypothetical protein